MAVAKQEWGKETALLSFSLLGRRRHTVVPGEPVPALFKQERGSQEQPHDAFYPKKKKYEQSEPPLIFFTHENNGGAVYFSS